MEKKKKKGKDSRGQNLYIGERQRSDGRYEFRKQVNGKVIYITKNSLKELREAEEALDRDISDNIDNCSEKAKMTLNEYYYQVYKKTLTIKPATSTNYDAIWENHVASAIGAIKLKDLTNSDIRRLYKHMSDNKYAHKTIKYIHTILHPLLEQALYDNIIRLNPAHKALKSTYGVSAEERIALSRKQQKALIDFVRASKVYRKYYPLILLAVGTGLRPSEIIGLTWSDIDLKSNIIHIDHEVVYKKFEEGKGYAFHVMPPKTEKGYREVPISLEMHKQLICCLAH